MQPKVSNNEDDGEKFQDFSVQVRIHASYNLFPENREANPLLSWWSFN